MGHTVKNSKQIPFRMGIYNQLEAAISLQPADATIQELRNIAYKKLREEEGALIDNYESKLQGDIIAGLSLMAGSNASPRDRMQTILDHKMKEINRDIWKLGFRSFRDYQKQNVDGMLASLIKQISTHRPYIPKTVQHLGEFKNKGGRPDSKTLQEALVTSMHRFSAVYLAGGLIVSLCLYTFIKL